MTAAIIRELGWFLKTILFLAWTVLCSAGVAAVLYYGAMALLKAGGLP